ncbi:MAG: DUF2683 family protein [Candidatus Aenigmatarchaeota archaeon]
MVQTLIDLNEEENKVVNVVKGQFGFTNKSEAINFIIEKFEEGCMEPELRPEFVEKMLKIQKEKPIPVKDFKKRYGLD